MFDCIYILFKLYSNTPIWSQKENKKFEFEFEFEFKI